MKLYNRKTSYYIPFIPSRFGSGKTANKTILQAIKMAKVDETLPRLSIKTQNDYIQTLSSIFMWAKKKKFIDENPFDEVEMPAQDIYLIIQNLIRLSVYDKDSYSLYNAKELTAISSEEDDETIWTTKYINTSWNQFKDASLLIFGLLHTIFEKNNLTNIFSPTKYISADKFEELKKYLSSEELKNIFCGYLNYDGYTSFIQPLNLRNILVENIFDTF